MRRAVLLAATLSLVGMVPGSPAEAHVEVCAGLPGTMTTPPMFYPTLGPPAAGGVMILTLPTCATGGPLVAVGTISGWCGHALGAAAAPGGHNFIFVIETNLMTLVGGINGELSVNPDPLVPGNSCAAPGGAGAWTAVGVVAA